MLNHNSGALKLRRGIFVGTWYYVAAKSRPSQLGATTILPTVVQKAEQDLGVSEETIRKDNKVVENRANAAALTRHVP